MINPNASSAFKNDAYWMLYCVSNLQKWMIWAKSQEKMMLLWLQDHHFNDFDYWFLPPDWLWHDIPKCKLRFEKWCFLDAVLWFKPQKWPNFESSKVSSSRHIMSTRTHYNFKNKICILTNFDMVGSSITFIFPLKIVFVVQKKHQNGWTNSDKSGQTTILLPTRLQGNGCKERFYW